MAGAGLGSGREKNRTGVSPLRAGFFLFSKGAPSTRRRSDVVPVCRHNAAAMHSLSAKVRRALPHAVCPQLGVLLGTDLGLSPQAFAARPASAARAGRAGPRRIAVAVRAEAKQITFDQVRLGEGVILVRALCPCVVCTRCLELL